MQVMVFSGWRWGLTLGFGLSPGATHSFICFKFMYMHHFSSLVTKRSNSKVRQFRTFLVTVLFYQCFETLSVEFRSSAEGQVVDIQINIVELCCTLAYDSYTLHMFRATSSAFLSQWKAKESRLVMFCKAERSLSKEYYTLCQTVKIVIKQKKI